jgi:hypothetical protein
MPKTVFDVLNDNIDEEISSASVFLEAGSPKDYAGYREIVGLIRGLNSAKHFISDLAKTYGENDD